MKLRDKETGDICSSGRFNIYSINEIIVCWDGDMDSDFISQYDVWLELSKQWKDLRQAFKDHDVITDNYNTSFFEPTNADDKLRGFTLD